MILKISLIIDQNPILYSHEHSHLSARGRKKLPMSNCPGQVNCALGHMKMEVWWSDGQVKLKCLFKER